MKIYFEEKIGDPKLFIQLSKDSISSSFVSSGSSASIASASGLKNSLQELIKNDMIFIMLNFT
ncbi:hypothetical protein MHK_003098 [Candidatus Magnetomorum sp. HK-1]|nr:hypothetical protein MHK_003098 [Candidatus Magnetomorum sp. HK-1]